MNSVFPYKLENFLVSWITIMFWSKIGLLWPKTVVAWTDPLHISYKLLLHPAYSPVFPFSCLSIPLTGMLVAVTTIVNGSHFGLVCIYQSVPEGSVTVGRMTRDEGKSWILSSLPCMALPAVALALLTLTRGRKTKGDTELLLLLLINYNDSSKFAFSCADGSPLSLELLSWRTTLSCADSPAPNTANQNVKQRDCSDTALIMGEMSRTGLPPTFWLNRSK